MGFAATHNKGSRFSINSEGFPYKNLSDLELNTEYKVRGVYILTKRGRMRQDMPNAITDKAIINLPSHLVNDIEDILKSEEYINQIEDGKLYFSVYEYNDENGTHRSISWIDK